MNMFKEQEPINGKSNPHYKYCVYCCNDYNPEYIKKHLETQKHNINVSLCRNEYNKNNNINMSESETEISDTESEYNDGENIYIDDIINLANQDYINELIKQKEVEHQLYITNNEFINMNKYFNDEYKKIEKQQREKKNALKDIIKKHYNNYNNSLDNPDTRKTKNIKLENINIFVNNLFNEKNKHEDYINYD